MAATIDVPCPKCKRMLKAPESARGKKIKCRHCEEVFPVAAKAGSQVKAAAGGADEEWGVIKAYGVEPIKDKLRCPHCAWELENDDDVVCLHCGYNLMTRERLPAKVLEPVTGGDYVAFHLPAVVCALVALFFLGFIVALWTGTPDLSPVGLGWMQTQKWAYVYGSAVCGFVVFFTARFAVKRLIIQRHPPEKEKKIKKKET